MKELEYQKTKNEAEDLENLDPLHLYLKSITKTELLNVTEEKELSSNIRQGLDLKDRIFAEVRLPETELENATRLFELMSREFINRYQHCIFVDENTKRLLNLAIVSAEKLFSHNLQLVVAVAKRYMDRGLPLMDLIQNGNFGLQKAVVMFDGKLGYKFSTYAYNWIKAEVSRNLEYQASNLPIPIQARAGHKEITKILTEQFPDQDIDLLDEQIVRTILKDHKIKPFIIDSWFLKHQKTVSMDQKNDDNFSLDQVVPHSELRPDQAAILSETRQHLTELISSLAENRQELVCRYYGLNGYRPENVSQIAEQKSVTKQAIHTLIQKSIGELRVTAMRNGFSWSDFAEQNWEYEI